MTDFDSDYAQVTDKERKPTLPTLMNRLARRRQMARPPIQPARQGEGFITTNSLADSEAEM